MSYYCQPARTRSWIVIVLIWMATGRGDVHSAEPAIVLGRSAWFAERRGTYLAEPDVRVHVNTPLDLPRGQRTRVLIYALPNGNTIEQTLGCRRTPELDWRFDIQHVAAQLRLWRAIQPDERLVLVCAEAGGRSWPAWRQQHADANRRVIQLVDSWRVRFGGEDSVVAVCGHSGGGSLLFGVIEAAPAIPAWIDRIVFLDANYAFEAEKHGAKLWRWLTEDDARQLVVLAYDDRHIELDGKRVVGPEGGTFRATRRMIQAVPPEVELSPSSRPPFHEHVGLHGRVRFLVHTNPQNKILHTALVGEMNGLIHALTMETAQESAWGTWGGPRAYERWIQPAPDTSSVPPAEADARVARFRVPLPPRAADATGGMALMSQIAPLSLPQREAIVTREILAGNIPNFLRNFQRVPIDDEGNAANLPRAFADVMCDYLAVGSDEDFVRVPLTPQTAQRIADRLGCVLPTRKLVDAIDRAAAAQVEPRPLTEQRESVATFVQHQQLIQAQCRDLPRGQLITGIKKDVVLSPRIFERPHRLAIYGWRKLDGRPIQNLTVVHVDHYVDYSHGIRLIRNTVDIDGQPVDLLELLRSEQRCRLVSDEGAMDPPRYGP